MSMDTAPTEKPDNSTEAPPPAPLESSTPLSNVKTDSEFYFPDGNVYLRVNQHEFCVHRFKLLEFHEMRSMLETEAASRQVVELEGDENDFRNTFRVLYASLYYSGIADFDAPVLASALRLATRYNHPALRKFAIDHLELIQLPPMDYLPLAREFSVVEWETRALDHLTMRDEPITVAEASLLGTESFVAMIVRREHRLLHSVHLRSSQAKHATPTTEVSGTMIKSAQEDVIDLSDAPDDQPHQDNHDFLDQPIHSEKPASLDSSQPVKHPRTRLHLRQSLSSTPDPSGKQFAHQHGVAKKTARKRKHTATGGH